jgi:hypothetical protein
MRAPAPRRGLLFLLGLLVVVLALRFWPSGSQDGSAPPRATAAGSTARPGGTPASASEIPPLALQDGRGEIGGGVVRNVFAFHVPPTPTPKPLPPVPTPIPVPGQAQFIGPRLPTPTPTATPIVPPAIPYRAIGVFGPRDKPIVTFEDGPRLINAREGDVLDGRFILKRVGRESVDFAFVGLPPEITRRIPVLPPDALR